MKKNNIVIYISISIIFVFALVVHFKDKGTVQKSSFLKEITYTKYEELIRNKETFVLYIGNDDCPNCADYLPRLLEVIEEYEIEVKYLNTSNVSLEDQTSFKKDISLRGVPATLFIKEGEEVSTMNRIIGAQSKKAIITKLKENKYID